MNQSVFSYQLRLHFIVLIFGFTGILGKLIALPATLIVLYRMVIACVALFIYLKIKKVHISFRGKDHRKWLLTGLLVGLHWFFFFESIKQSTVSVALVSLSSTALFTAIIEPIFKKKGFEWIEIVFSILIIIGMVIVLRFEYQYTLGIFYGVLCALLASIFTVLNSKFVVDNQPSVISFYELLGGAVFILSMILLFDFNTLVSTLPTFNDLIYLLLLGIVATAVAFVISVLVMTKLPAFTVSLTINLEPLYGIILAIIIFGEEELMSFGFYIGFAIILSTILINAYVKKKGRKRNITAGMV